MNKAIHVKRVLPEAVEEVVMIRVVVDKLVFSLHHHRSSPRLLGMFSAAVLFALGAGGGQAYAFSWFWEKVPAGMNDGSRFRALEVVSAAYSGTSDRERSTVRVRSVLERWQPEIEVAARNARISEALIAAVIVVESGGNPRAVSPAGAMGLGQLMPGTARRYGVRDPFDPQANLVGSAMYLSDLVEMFRNDIVLALAAYNAGENAVLRHAGVPPYEETRAYVPKVLSAFNIAGNFCATPPRTARRQCQLPQRFSELARN